MTIQQGSPEWFSQRLGKCTASRVADVVARTKSGPSASRANYLAQLVAERLTGTLAESFTSAAMQWGVETEPEARRAYEFFRDASIAEVGFVDHPALPMTGASPDGLVGADGLVEIKSPSTATHLDTLLSSKIPSKYDAQIQWQLACTGRKWCDFASYDPRMPAAMRLFVDRVARDDARIAELEVEIGQFLAEVEMTVAALRRLYSVEDVAGDTPSSLGDLPVSSLQAGTAPGPQV